jgi:phospholipase C
MERGGSGIRVQVSIAPYGGTTPLRNRTSCFRIPALIAFSVACIACSDPPSKFNVSASFVPALQASNVLPILRSSGAGKISHVIVIIQENRSFDNLFQGYPGADTVSSGANSLGQIVSLAPVSLATRYVIDHSASAMFAACDGAGSLPGTRCRMDGFDGEVSFYAPSYLAFPQYTYVPQKESKPYFDMAHEGVLADRMFQSQIDESFVAHQYLIAARANGSVDLPLSVWGCDGGADDTVGTIMPDRTIGPSQTACFDYPTLGDELDQAKLSWRFYTSTIASSSGDDGAVWSGYQAIRHIRYGPDWQTDVITPQTRFLTDVAKSYLANVTWITPICVNSDHVNCGGGFGPSWVASLVNVVGKSKYWGSTAIVVLWDDWGGLYDHVPPPYKSKDGLGFRVPLIVISPYAKAGYVSHVQYESASILRFAEDLFGLPQLSVSDRRAASLAADCFDFTKAPRKFVPVHAPKAASFFLHQHNDGRAPDYE